MKKCNLCKKNKPLTDFYKSANSRCKNCHKKWRKQYYIQNSQHQIQKQIEWNNKNREYRNNIYLKKWRKETQYQNIYQRHRYKNDILYKLSNLMRSRTYCALKVKYWTKNQTMSKYLGCSLDELKQHLEKQFQFGMNWDNYGFYGWHIDHIIPLSKAKTKKELFQLCHYTNLQPLWSRDNLVKSNKI